MANNISNIIDEAVKSNRILSLSGGGVKGVAELVVLAEIENRTGKSISELFPIITGTSVGGLIGALLTIPKIPGSKESKYSAKEALEIFKEAAPKIFPDEFLGGVKQVFTHKYSQKPLEKILDEYLGNLCLGDATSRLMIPVTNLSTDGREVEVFDSHNVFGSSGHSNPKIKDVLLATTAAPTYFKPVTNTKFINGHIYKAEVAYAYVDGGLGANRPAYEALKLLKSGKNRLEQTEILDKTMVLSLNFDNDIGASNAIPKIGLDGIVGWLVKGKLVSRLMNNTEDSATEEVRSELGDDKFVEVLLPITKETKSLDNAKKKNLATLEEVGRKYIEQHDDQLQKLCNNLMYNLNKNQEIKTNANHDDFISDMLVESNIVALNEDIISEELKQQLVINLNATQFNIIKYGIEKLSSEECKMVQTFLQGLNDEQIIALSKELPLIADDKFKNTDIPEFSNLQNKFLQLFRFAKQDEIIPEVALDCSQCSQEYQNEIVCDGRGSEWSHHIDIT